jgi:release factor H-coupled RctB family protein
MVGRVGATRSGREGLTRTSFGGLVVCEDRQLLVEEAPQAYKDPTHVVGELRSAGLADSVAALKPLLTYKKSVSEERGSSARGKRKPSRDGRGER